ncbi:aminoglycoside phosphotransferase family protein [Candidatus Woesearchaeota archaeon]|nr:aminoglycoside phosphotransferase family protein [Candidatus Woesearchaeota archaeon]
MNDVNLNVPERYSPDYYETILRSVLSESGIDDSELSLEDVGLSKLGDYKNSVLERVFRYRLHGETKELNLIERSFSKGKYTEEDVPQIENEIFFSEKMPLWMRGQNFHGLPLLKYKYVKDDDFRETVLYHEKVGDYTLNEVLPGYSQKAQELEQRILEEGNLNIDEARLNTPASQRLLNELDAYGRIEFQGNGLCVYLKPKIKKLLTDRPLYLHNDPKKILDNVFEMILSFNKSSSELCKYNQEVIDSTKTIVYDSNSAIADFKKSLLRIRPGANNLKLFKDLVHYYERNFVDFLLRPNLSNHLVHGDTNPRNIVFGEGGHRGSYLIDFGHLKLVKNPLIDFADFLTYQYLFGALNSSELKGEYQALRQKSISETHTTQNHMYFTELNRGIDVLGMLANRIRRSHDPEHIHHRGHNLEGMLFRFPRYLNFVNTLVNDRIENVDFSNRERNKQNKFHRFCNNLRKFLKPVTLEKILNK